MRQEFTICPDVYWKWQDMGFAPKDRWIIVYCEPTQGLGSLVSLCRWHEDAGFCVDEIREPTYWTDIPLQVLKDWLDE